MPLKNNSFSNSTTVITQHNKHTTTESKRTSLVLSCWVLKALIVASHWTPPLALVCSFLIGSFRQQPLWLPLRYPLLLQSRPLLPQFASACHSVFEAQQLLQSASRLTLFSRRRECPQTWQPERCCARVPLCDLWTKGQCQNVDKNEISNHQNHTITSTTNQHKTREKCLRCVELSLENWCFSLQLNAFHTRPLETRSFALSVVAN